MLICFFDIANQKYKFTVRQASLLTINGIHFIRCFAPTPCNGATPDIRSPAYLNKTRGIDCERWDEIARRCQSTTRVCRLRIYQCLRTVNPGGNIYGGPVRADDRHF